MPLEVPHGLIHEADAAWVEDGRGRSLARRQVLAVDAAQSHLALLESSGPRPAPEAPSGGDIVARCHEDLDLSPREAKLRGEVLRVEGCEQNLAACHGCCRVRRSHREVLGVAPQLRGVARVAGRVAGPAPTALAFASTTWERGFA